MGSRRVPGQVLRATLCEIERGLFHVSYQSDVAEWGAQELPAYQVGACAAEAKQRIEEQAQGCGFETVVWDYALFIPTSLLDPTDKPTQPTEGLPASG